MLSRNGFAVRYPVYQAEIDECSALHATSSIQHVGVADYPITQSTVQQIRVNDGIRTDFPTASPMMKRSPGDSVDPPAKQIKSEHPEEFSNAVKKRLASSTRTGQACDRCKVRKIRCDGLPGGCSPCLQNNTECRTTDRITGRATSRGYVEGLEQQNRELQHRLHDAEQRLAQGGLGGKPLNGYNTAGGPTYGYNASPPAPPAWNPPDQFTPQSSNPPTSHGQETNIFKALPAFRPGSFGDNYLGISAGNSNISSIKGTALSILGMEIDIADFESFDMDEPKPATGHQHLYNKSYQAFLQSTLGVNARIEKMDLPPRAEGMQYVGWYLRLLNQYMPILHGPTFLALITRMYDDPNFCPSTAETVTVHMVFAIMYFQYASRNFENIEQQSDLNHKSNMHYHYSLSMFYELSCSHTVQDVQALTMICTHLRNFPKPGASWILCQTTMSLAIELGMHRSSKRWAADAVPNILDVEMRKRIFWSLLAVHVTLCGKLGRPMPIRLEDMDVEMPEPLDDELLSENGLDTSRPGTCAHEIGLQAFGMVPLMIELYGTIYAVRREPETYIATIIRLEAKIRAWKNGHPPSIVTAGPSEPDRVPALYLVMWELEFRLLLRHPSVSMTNDAGFNAESMDKCADASHQMLGVVRELQKYKSLDTTWYQSAVYVMAITTTLFAQWNKRGTTSAGDLVALEVDMNKWLEVMGEVGSTLGSGMRLREAVRTVTNSTLSLLHRSLPSRTAYSQGSIHNDHSKSPVERSRSASTYPGIATNYYDASSSNGGPAAAYSPINGHMAHSQTPYPAATQYSSYSEPPSSSMSYRSGDNPHTYSSYQTSSEATGAPLLTAFANQAHSQSHNQSHQAQSWQRSPHLADAGSMAWHQYTNTVSGSDALSSHDAFPANALMSLGRSAGPNNQANAALSVLVMNAQNMEHSGNQMENLGGHLSEGTWPLNLFDINHGGAL